MSLFGPNPIHPLPAQSALAAQQVRPLERTQPAGEATRRMKDAIEQRVAGTESESAVRRTADEHAESEREAKKERRDGRRDGFSPRSSATDASPPAPSASIEPGKRLDLTA